MDELLPIIGIFLAIAVGVMLYASYAALAVSAGAAAGFVIGTGQTIGCYLVPMWQVLTAQTEALEPPVRTLAERPDADPAVVDYLHGPAGVDLAYVRQLASGRFELGSKAWSDRLGTWAGERQEQLVTVPPSIGMGIGLAVGIVPGGLVVLLLAGVHTLVVGTMTLLWRGTGLVLRGLDSGLRWLRNIRMRCLACGRRIPYPAYVCPGCGDTHWDIRPGRLGILRRTCRCGRRLPTLLILGTAALVARCPYRGCGSELRHRPGTLPEVVLPVFGATGAGKTRLMDALVVALQERGTLSGVSVEFADAPTGARLAGARERLIPEHRTPATPLGLQRGMVLRVAAGGREQLVELFDAAGERYVSEARAAELLFLGSGRTYLFVIDPMAVEGFWGTLPVAERERLEPLRPKNVPAPSAVYQQTVDQILHQQGAPHRSRLAVVLSRADVLGAAAGSDVDAWAAEIGLAGLLRTARIDFKEVQVFRTAAVIRGDRMDESVQRLLGWALVVPAGDMAPVATPVPEQVG